MTLDGFRLPAYLGWISGLLFVSKPWGKDVAFTSYCHPYTVFALSINLIYTVLWHDFYLALSPTIEGYPLSKQILTLSATVGFHFFNGFSRWVYLIFAKRISTLFQYLSKALHGIPRYGRVWWIGMTSLYFLLIFQTGLSVTYAFYFYRISSQPDAQSSNRTSEIIHSSVIFNEQMRPWWYFIIFFLFATLPASVSVYFTFCFIFVLTYLVLQMFEEFCKSIMDMSATSLEQSHRHHQPRKNSETFVINLSDISEANPPNADMTVSLLHDRFRGADLSSSLLLQMKAELLEKFERVRDIFDQYDLVVGPLLLGMLIRSVFVVINDVTEILIKWNPTNFTTWDVSLGCNALNLFGDLAQFLILELGSWAHGRMSKWKLDLERMIILMPASMKKDHLSDVVRQVSKWKWQMSAWGFFSINRQLMSGIVSTMLSYVVILFQLHVSEQQQQQPV